MMHERRLLFIDKVVVAVCCFWLIGWVLWGLVFAADVFQRQASAMEAWRKAAAVFALFSSIGCIALIGLWPHRDLLRRGKRVEGNAFVVQPKGEETE
ncbi:MAG TPA: hypothetical protein VGN72_16400 [Tepidisphaeraceae bacterium]|jgi:hypothetical protein|nr:hypothetical protein [Tepidisphaeraceae bacterium]